MSASAFDHFIGSETHAVIVELPEEIVGDVGVDLIVLCSSGCSTTCEEFATRYRLRRDQRNERDKYDARPRKERRGQHRGCSLL